MITFFFSKRRADSCAGDSRRTSLSISSERSEIIYSCPLLDVSDSFFLLVPVFHLQFFLVKRQRIVLSSAFYFRFRGSLSCISRYSRSTRTSLCSAPLARPALRRDANRHRKDRFWKRSQVSFYRYLSLCHPRVSSTGKPRRVNLDICKIIRNCLVEIKYTRARVARTTYFGRLV